MWHGSAVEELLKDVDHHAAGSRPILNAHSIWELVLHLTVWAGVALRRAQGEKVNPSDAEDWPLPADLDAEGWARDRGRLTDAHKALSAFAAGLSESQLEGQVAGQDYPLRAMLHGVVEHDCYHGGQIALLRKLVGEGST